jgi:hypothetical protein
MRALREQPRLAGAKLSISLAALIVALVVGSALAGDDSLPPAGLRPALERSEQLRRDRANELARLTAELRQLRGDLSAATRHARTHRRASQQLRQELRAARRSLARQRNQ